MKTKHFTPHNIAVNSHARECGGIRKTRHLILRSNRKEKGISWWRFDDVLDLAFLNSIYHSGVYNLTDNAVRACQTTPGQEVHFAQLLAGHQTADEISFD